MDFSTIFQLRTKRFWWMDVIFYFAISLLVATLFCYVIFLVKDGFQRQDIKKTILDIEKIATSQQKQDEQVVLTYQKKIGDFATLLKNHQFASNAFAFMQSETRPGTWFKQFSMDEKNNSIQLSGECDDLDSFSRQVAVFENNKYVKSLGTLSSTVADSTRVQFNIALSLNQDIFSYVVNQTLAAQAQQNAAATETNPATPNPAQPAENANSSEKSIATFLFLSPATPGVVDDANHTVTLSVPFGTNVKGLVPSIAVSEGAAILPLSGVPQDFTNPINYTVTAQDGTTQVYQAKVVVGPAPKTAKKPGQSVLIIIIAVILVVAIIAAAALFVWKGIVAKKKANNLKSNAS